MAREGGLNRLVRNLFNKNEKSSDVAEKAVPEKTDTAVPNGFSRRSVLRGAAAAIAAPEKSAQAVAAAAFGLPSSPELTLAPDVVGRAAAELMPYAKLQLLLNLNDSTTVKLRRLETEEHDETKMLLDFLSGNQDSLPDAQTIQGIADAFGYIRSQNSVFPPSLRLADMQNPDILATAYKLAGAVPGAQPGGNELQALGKMFQSISGLSGSATINEVNGVFLKKQRAYAERVLTQIDSFDNVIERKDILQNIRLSLDDESPETSELIGRMLEKEMELQPAYKAAMKVRTRGEHQERLQELNGTLESRGKIYCDISRVSSTRASGKERSFRFRPVGYTPRSSLGLNRMNIEQYRQSLYAEAGKASEFVPAEPIVIENVDNPENGIVIETSDPLLISELEKALMQGARITIPDRLQIPSKN